jgi:hypothetical protein
MANLEGTERVNAGAREYNIATQYLVKNILAVERMDNRKQVWASNSKAGNYVCLHA